MQITRQVLRACTVAIALAAGVGTAAANPRPFHAAIQTTFTTPMPGSLGCFTPPSGVFTIAGGGQVTHLGKSTLAATSEIQFGGPGQCVDAVLTAANGDELHFHVDDLATPPDPDGNITFSGTWTVTGGTGRFGGATGGGTIEGSANLFSGTGELTQDGTISY